MPKNFPCTAANLIRNTPSPWYSDSSIYYKFCWSYFEFTSEYPAGEYRLILFYGSCCVDSRFHNLHMYPKIRVMFKWYLYLPATTKGHFDLQQARDRKIDILIVDVDKQACGGMAMGCAPNSQEWWACELLQSWTMTHFWPLSPFFWCGCGLHCGPCSCFLHLCNQGHGWRSTAFLFSTFSWTSRQVKSSPASLNPGVNSGPCWNIMLPVG